MPGASSQSCPLMPASHLKSNEYSVASELQEQAHLPAARLYTFDVSFVVRKLWMVLNKAVVAMKSCQ